MSENKNRQQKGTEKANERINEEFYGEEAQKNFNDKDGTSKPNKTNEKLNKKFYEDDQQSDIDLPIQGGNNIPATKINKDKKR